jgi:hypothetical protein
VGATVADGAHLARAPDVAPRGFGAPRPRGFGAPRPPRDAPPA